MPALTAPEETPAPLEPAPEELTTEPQVRVRRRVPSALAILDGAGALLPAALVLFFSFQAGGFFPGAPAFAAFVLAVGLALRVTLAGRPFAALGRPVTVAAAALTAFAAWTLLSTNWSHAPGRALLEFDRTLLYLLCFLICATLPWSPQRLAWALRALVVAIGAVCLAGLASRLAPDVFSVKPSFVPERLSFPLTYWNAQGLIGALGLLLAGHLACSEREPRWVRALGAGAVPLMTAALFLTFSRGALLGVVAGLVTYAVLLRSRGLLLGLLATAIPTATAVGLCYDADLLASASSTSAAAAEQGHGVAQGLLLCVLGAVTLSLAVDRWVRPRAARVKVPAGARRPLRIGAVLLAVVILGVLPAAAGAPGYAQHQYDRFVQGDKPPSGPQRERFLNPANNGRRDNWRVAYETWQRNAVRGTGAGTYQSQWYQHRRSDADVTDAHSFYLELLSELGLVGAGLMGLALLTLGGTVVLRTTRRRRPTGADPSAFAVVGAVFVTWGVHAGLDWMWEVPAVTAWVWALAGLALAIPVSSAGIPSPGRNVRVAIGLGCLALAVIPFGVFRSQARLDEAVRAFGGTPRSCPRAIDASLASLSSVGARPEPWEIIAYCDVGENQPALAVLAARNAVARDPQKWTYHYALALVQGVAGKDPRPEARRALALNPRSPLAQKAVEAYGKARRSRWPAVSRTLKLPRD